MEKIDSGGMHTLTYILEALSKLSREDQIRTLLAVTAYLNIDLPSQNRTESPAQRVLLEGASAPTGILGASFSENRTITPKDFMRDKQPQTDIERATCLAYYLTHYRDTPHFKTLDISALNTEAAQPKFSNASFAVDNAIRAGYLVQATKGMKQITAIGESFVQHLPDRDAAKSAAHALRPKRPRKSSRT